MKASIQTKMLAAILIACALPFLALVGIVLWPYNPLTINSVNIINPGNTVIAGENVLYSADVVKHTNKPGKVIRQLINSRVITYSAIDGNIDQGGRIVNNYLETSAADLPGYYYMKFTAVYTYFGFWEVTVSANSKLFQMIAHHDELKEGKEGKQGVQGKRGPAGKNFWGK
jgi:hypothetical protein